MRKIVVDEHLQKVYRVIGDNVFRLRGSMSQNKLAKEANLSRETILAVEKGRATNLETIIKIAQALDVSLADLFITNEDRNEVSYQCVLLLKKLSESLGLQPIKKEGE